MLFVFVPDTLHVGVQFVSERVSVLVREDHAFHRLRVVDLVNARGVVANKVVVALHSSRLFLSQNDVSDLKEVVAYI